MLERADLRLVEVGFPCHQAGAKTTQEQSVGLPPPVNCVHAWWAKRRLTPDRSTSVRPPDWTGNAPDIFTGQFGIDRLREWLK